MPGTWTNKLILAAVRREVTPDLVAAAPDGGLRNVLAVANRHGVSGWVARELRTASRNGPTTDVLLSAVTASAIGNHRRRLADAATALRALNEAGIRAMVVKGPSLVDRYYHDPALRTYLDVDLVVDQDRLRSAITTLEQAGFILLDSDWPPIVVDVRGELTMGNGREASIDLHWHFLNDSRIRRTLSVEMREVWEGATSTTLAGARCLSPAPSDELAYVCLHAGLSGCTRLVWLLDIAMISTSGQVDWDGVARRLSRWKYGAGGYLVLALAAALTGCPIPLDDLRSLRPGARIRRRFQKMVQNWDLSNPAWPGRRDRMFFASAGDDLVTRSRLLSYAVLPPPGLYRTASGRGKLVTASRLTLGIAAAARDFVAGDRARAAARSLAPGDIAAGREAFLRAVEQAGRAARKSRSLSRNP